MATEVKLSYKNDSIDSYSFAARNGAGRLRAELQPVFQSGAAILVRFRAGWLRHHAALRNVDAGSHQEGRTGVPDVHDPGLKTYDITSATYTLVMYYNQGAFPIISLTGTAAR